MYETKINVETRFLWLFNVSARYYKEDITEFVKHIPYLRYSTTLFLICAHAHYVERMFGLSNHAHQLKNNVFHTVRGLETLY